MTNRAMLTVQCLTFAHCILQMKSSTSQEDHLFSVISADLVLLKTIPARFRAKESNLTQCRHEIQPAISEADRFLCLNDPQWCE